MFPKIADVGFVTIHTYGLLLALAFIAGIWLTSRNARRAGMNPDQIWNMGLIVIFAALVGAKVLLFLSDYSYYSQNPREIFSLSTLRSSGVYYGGLLLALGASALYLQRVKLPAWNVADLAAPGIALGQAIGRLGCLSAGCCYGKPTSLPWGITFTNKYAYENVGVPLNTPLHPTQIYEALATFLLFVFLTWRLSRKHFAGQIILEYLFSYAAIRFVVEFFRDDERGFVLNGLLSTSQLIGLATLLVSVALFFYLRGRRAEATES
ncbi:MAG TPA: prolipoprotein diacylglyceryl transferase [Acidobacteriota bacterium]|nr:prolipoprotein diacylglyceryl transferase [Acidobacteriota bacterium]